MLIALPNRPVRIMFLDKSKSIFFGIAILIAGLLQAQISAAGGFRAVDAPPANLTPNIFCHDRSVALPNSAIDFNQLVADAVASGTNVLRVPRAEYRIDRTLALTNVADLVIDGQGSVVVLDSNTLSHIVLMTNAKRVTLRDIAFDMDPLPYTQGILIATGIVGDEAYYDIRVDQGYRSDLAFFQADNAEKELSIRPYNAKSQLKYDALRINMTNVSSPIAGVLRFLTKDAAAAAANVQIGSRMATAAWRRSSIYMVRSEGIVLDKVTVFAAHGPGVQEFISSGLNAKICVTPGPTPARARAERVLSANRGGFDSRGAIIGPVIHDSLIERTGDDGIAINGLVGRIAGVQGNKFTFADGVDPGLAGTQVEVFSSQTWKSRGKVTVLSVVGQAMDVSSAIGAQARDFIATLEYGGANARIERNLIRDTDATGINVVSSGALVANNRISRTYLAAISMAYELDFYLVGPARNIVVTNNLIEDAAIGRQSRTFAAAIGVFPGPVTAIAPHIGTRDSTGLIFRDNVIRGSGTWGMVLSNVDGVLIERNRFIGTNALVPWVSASFFGPPPQSAVLIRDSRNVVFRDSAIEQPGPFMIQGILVDALSDANTIDTSGLVEN